MERFEARVSVARTLLLVAGGLAFVAIGLWFVWRPDMLSGPDGPPFLRGEPGLVQLIGGVAILFFGLMALIGLRQLARREPVIVIDGEGLCWRRWSDAVIPWSAIARMEVTEMMNQRFLSLWLVDPAAYPSTSLSGRMAAANKGMGFGDIAIAPAGLDCGVDDLTAAVDRFAPQG